MIKTTLEKVAPNITSGSRGWASFYSDDGALFLRMTNLPKNGIGLLLHDNKYVALPSGSSEGMRTRVQKNDILISITAELGKIGFVENDLGEAYVNQHVALVRIEEPDTHPKYVAYYLASQPQRNFLNRLNDSGAKAGLSLKTINQFPLTLPPLPEQKAIAEVLSVWDRAIEKTERLIQAKQKRLEGYGRSLFDRNKNGKYTGWKLIKLADVLDEHEDKSTGKEEVYSVSVHKGLINQIEHLGRSFSAANTDHYNRVHHGDIVYTKSPTGDFPLGIVKQSYSPNDAIVSPLYGVFTPQSYFLGVVIDFYFSSPTRTKNYLSPIVQKGAKNTIAITNKTFLSKKLHLPIEESAQRVVAEYVDTARKEIELLKKLAEKQKLQKRGLMQKLLAGEWRTGEANEGDTSVAHTEKEKG
jgi:type I restriction enzyme S subunit